MRAVKVVGALAVAANVLAGCATKSAKSDSVAAVDSTARIAAPALTPDSAGAVAARIDSGTVSRPAPATASGRLQAAQTTKSPSARPAGSTIGRDSAIEIPKGGPVRTLPEVPPKSPR